MIRVVGTYVFNVIGDGVDKELVISLRGLKAPDPIVDDMIPSGFFDARTGVNPGGATAKLEGEFARIIFDVPPPATLLTKLTIDAMFGTERT